MIEIGETTNSRMTYADAVFYCFCLGDGWRLPSINEYHTHTMYADWCHDERASMHHHTLHVTPVRDLKDD
jgi:hypothetical protein